MKSVKRVLERCGMTAKRLHGVEEFGGAGVQNGVRVSGKTRVHGVGVDDLMQSAFCRNVAALERRRRHEFGFSTYQISTFQKLSIISLK